MPRRTAPVCGRRTTSIDRISMIEEMSLVWGTAIVRELELTTRAQFSRPWARWGDEITRRWIEAMPGSRPMAAYLLGEIEPPDWREEVPSRRHPMRPIDGVDVVIDDTAWRCTEIEFDHLDALGLIDRDERKRARERLRRPSPWHTCDYRWMHDPDD